MTKNNRVATVGFLAVSTLALAGVTYFEAIPARAAPSLGAPSEPSTTTVAPAAVTVTESPTVSTAVAPAPPPQTDLRVPSLNGQRLSVARRTARRLGLVVLARDDGGERVPAEMAAYYRVRRQLTPAGAAALPGATVEVRVREAETPEGY